MICARYHVLPSATILGKRDAGRSLTIWCYCAAKVLPAYIENNSSASHHTWLTFLFSTILSFPRPEGVARLRFTSRLRVTRGGRSPNRPRVICGSWTTCCVVRQPATTAVKG